MKTLKLSKPVTINGEEMSEIQYDLESLTGADVQQALKDLASKAYIPGSTEVDPYYHAAVFAQAAGLSLDDISILKAKDFNKASQIVRDFFLEPLAEQ
jgi:hypothetical protein